MMFNKFLIGINYWPANKAMYWWKHFSIEEVKRDFINLSHRNYNLVRIFLTWEDFQPLPNRISAKALDNLKIVADLAAANGLLLMPTFFCGHMSGVNWMPDWMLTSANIPGRFPVFSNGLIKQAGIRNFYIDREVIEAQSLQVQKICTALQGHAGIFGYDLGNESSNCVTPPLPEEGQNWLETMTSQIRCYGGGIPVTLGMHAEDLEEDRHLGPQDAARYCDFLCMHGYPFYLSWADNVWDVEVLPYLGIITAWLGQKPVLFQEFGTPTYSVLPAQPAFEPQTICKCPLATENEAADYYRQSVERLYEENMIGCMAWCFADYGPDLWDKPPLRQNPHERYFGLFRYNGTCKPAAQILSRYVNRPVDSVFYPPQYKYSWLKGENRTLFYNAPAHNLVRLYKNYKESLT